MKNNCYVKLCAFIAPQLRYIYNVKDNEIYVKIKGGVFYEVKKSS